MRILVSTFNMYKGGSKTILDAIQSDLNFKYNILQVKCLDEFAHIDKKSFYVKYPIGQLNWLYRIFIESFYVPIVAYIEKCSKLVMLGNFPAVFWFGSQSVYFHNTLYLDSTYRGLKFFFERQFFKLSIRIKNPTLLVQTRYIQELVKMSLGSSVQTKVIGVPEIGINTERNIVSDSACVDFFYPAHFYPHKNHAFLVKNCNKYSLPTCRIILTIDSNSLKGYYTNNCYIKLVGSIDHDESIRILKRSHVLVFPSTSESLGLPLIEAVVLGKPIVAPDLPYVHAVVKNFYAFEANDASSLIRAMNQAHHDINNGIAKIPSSDVMVPAKCFVDRLLNDF